MISEEKSVEETEKPKPIKKTADLQRLKLEKLMKNFDKPVVIPERPKEKNISQAPEFVRNVMGSSAGAGSGEFHVYRHLRRKEYARQKFIQLKSEKEMLDEAYKRKLEQNAKMAEERTAKRRAKRLKKKEKMKNRKKKPKVENEIKQEVESNSESEESGEAGNSNENNGGSCDSNVVVKEEES
ncbi:UNVERIFIED_CONTAM: hypothetical protein PYX00_005282 [Menopon gallinae]|uniref:PRKR-interacting protein 1 n=1 Tax=Menopon gallinae TaxID=328185 RepID=A0AAW2HS84_9NEOP